MTLVFKSAALGGLLAIALLILPFAVAPAAAAQRLDTDRPAAKNQHVRINPFARPLKKAPVVSRRGATAIEKPAQLLQLRGVLNAGDNSFANVDGTIVGLGEQVGDLRLISVGDGEAVFKRTSATNSSRGAASTITLLVRSADKPASPATPDTPASAATGQDGLAGAARPAARASSASQYVQVSEQ